jgi:hypothetical protein
MNAATQATDTSPFSRSLRGTEPQAVDREFPALLSDLYEVADQRRAGNANPSEGLPGSWQRLDDVQLRDAGFEPELLHSEKSGFDAAIYRDDGGRVVVAFCGTDEGKDWQHNIGQGLGIKDPQYEAALRVTREARRAFGDEVVLTGHSLGGGLTAAAAMTTDTPAVTYNAAGVNNRTLEREGIDAAAAKDYAKEGLIRGYHVKNEILTHFQEDSFPLKYALPDAAGHQIQLPDPDPLPTLERLVPGKMLLHRLDLHGIESVMESQHLQQLRAQEAAPAGQPMQPLRANDTANTLIRDAVGKLSEQREHLGLQDDAKFLNAATGLAAHAGADGLSRIDHLVPDGRGNGVFAVEGRLDDPAHRRSHVDANQAAQVPADQSAQQLRAQSHMLAAQQQETALQQHQAPRPAMSA